MNLKSDLNIKNNYQIRHYDLDWLRVLSVLLLVDYHSAAVFYQGELGDFYIKNDLLSPVLGWVIFFVSTSSDLSLDSSRTTSTSKIKRTIKLLNRYVSSFYYHSYFK